jgi:hypothetical protein
VRVATTQEDRMPRKRQTGLWPTGGDALGRRAAGHRAEATLYQYERCCDDWRHHDAIIWELPVAAITANAVIVWAAASAGHAWHLALAWGIAGLVVGIMSLGLGKQLAYAGQIQERIRQIELEFGLPKVTRQVGRPGFVSGSMMWLLRGLCLVDLVLAGVYVLRPSLLM